MRIVMYTQDYEPLALLDVAELDVAALRAHPGDTVQIHFPEISNYLAGPLDRIAARVYRGMLLVEGMRWADGETRPILVVRGRELGEQILVNDREDGPSAAMELFRAAVNAAYLREPTLRERIRPPAEMVSMWAVDELARRIDADVYQRVTGMVPIREQRGDQVYIANVAGRLGSMSTAANINAVWNRIAPDEGYTAVPVPPEPDEGG